MRGVLSSLLAGVLALGCGNTEGRTPTESPSTSGGDGGAGSPEPPPEEPKGGAGGAPCAGLPVSNGDDEFIGDLSLGSADTIVVPYTRVTGNLVISGGTRVELPYLEEVGGDISMEGSSVVELYLPALREVGGKVWVYVNWSLRELDLRSLARVAGRVFIHRNIELRVLQIDSLTDVGEMVEINGNLALPECFLDRVNERFSYLLTTPPPCKGCTRSCGVVTAQCE